MARLGLGEHWKCTFANEWCPKKAAAYAARFGHGAPPFCRELMIQDVATLTPQVLPGTPELVWASFPCQDLSLAGKGKGLHGKRSGNFWPFWDLMKGLVREDRAPKLIVIENVVGAITSNKGEDFSSLFQTLVSGGYRVGPMVIDAARFLPQSRPRLFVVAVRDKVNIPGEVHSVWPVTAWHPQSLICAWGRLRTSLRKKWIWWTMPEPTGHAGRLSSIIEEEPRGVEWHSAAETRRLVSLMSDLNRQKLRDAQEGGVRRVGAVYRRTRPNNAGEKIQRAEVRFDDFSGCLRTPAGGSSRQIILVVEGSRLRSRLLAPREAARLMGVPEDYTLPGNYNEAYHLLGDGLAVPVVAWLSKHLLLKVAHARLLEEAA